MNEEVKVLNEKIRQLVEMENLEIDFLIEQGGYTFFLDKDVTIAVANLGINIHKTTSYKTCYRAATTWRTEFFALDRSGMDKYILESDKLDMAQIYLLIKKIATSLNLTLKREYDMTVIKELNAAKALKEENKTATWYFDALKRDKEIFAFFEERFHIMDYDVIKHFLWAMGRSTYDSQLVITTVEKVWRDLEVKHKPNISLYLPIISKYTQDILEKK